MIIKEIILSNEETKFELKCEKSGKLFERIKKKDNKINNTEKTLCDEEIIKFKKWMNEKDYLKTDCWCKHLQEFKKT